jgi:hypothetical protein
MSWIGFGRNRSRFNRGTFLACLEGPRKTMKTSVRTSGVHAELRIEHLQIQDLKPVRYIRHHVWCLGTGTPLSLPAAISIATAQDLKLNVITMWREEKTDLGVEGRRFEFYLWHFKKSCRFMFGSPRDPIYFVAVSDTARLRPCSSKARLDPTANPLWGSLSESRIIPLPIYLRTYSCLRHYATSRKVAGSSSDEVDFFNWPNSSSRTMALGSTQPLTQMSTRNLPGGKGRPARKADNLTAICVPTV